VTGQGGLLPELVKAVLERGLGAAFDRRSGTNDYGRKVLRRIAAEAPATSGGRFPGVGVEEGPVPGGGSLGSSTSRRSMPLRWRSDGPRGRHAG
jgi:hypothetical protein